MTFKLHPQLAKDSIEIGQFSLCRLLLINDQQYPWFVLVPQRADIKEIYQLSEIDQQQMWQESRILSKVIMEVFNGDKLNVAAIGNLVAQLHIHHVVRFKTDISWPAPIWGQHPMIEYDNDEIEAYLAKIVPRLVNFKPSLINLKPITR